MSYHTCEFCGAESRFVCVQCKKDICKTHAFYERDQESRAGDWVCTDCHSSNMTFSCICGIIGFIIMIIFAAVMISVINSKMGQFPSFP